MLQNAVGVARDKDHIAVLEAALADGGKDPSISGNVFQTFITLLIDNGQTVSQTSTKKRKTDGNNVTNWNSDDNDIQLIDLIADSMWDDDSLWDDSLWACFESGNNDETNWTSDDDNDQLIDSLMDHLARFEEDGNNQQFDLDEQVSLGQQLSILAPSLADNESAITQAVAQDDQQFDSKLMCNITQI
jgi:hypothetical protein